MTLAEPLHVDSEPRDGWYFVYSKPTDINHPYKTRHKIPVRIWTHAPRDEAGDLIDDVRQYVLMGNELVVLSQDDWLYVAKHPISEEDYTTLFITGDWK